MILQAKSSRYDTEIDVSSNSTHARVVQLIGSDKRVLELGCATGYMSRVLREQGCQVVAIEIDPKAAECASVCERVIVGDIEQINLALELGADRFEAIVAADFLEHLKDPGRILLELKEYIGPGGYLVASLPNVAHGSVRLALLGGHFPYGEKGLLDRTHLRFYTHETLKKLFEDAGFVIEHIERQLSKIDATEVPYDKEVIPAGLLDALSGDQEALTYQFIVVAYPAPLTELESLRRRFRELTEEKEAAQRDVAELKERVEEQARLEQQIGALIKDRESARLEVGELQRSGGELVEEKEGALREVADLRQIIADQAEQWDALNSQVKILSSREGNLRSLLLDAHDQLIRRDDELSQAIDEQARLRQALQEQAHLHHLLHTLTEEKEAAHREANALRQTIQEQSGLSDQIESAVEEKEAVQCEVADLRQIIADQAEQLEALTGNVKILSSREKELRSLLLDAHDQLIRRDDELQTFVYQFQNSVPGLQQNATSNASSESSVAKNYISYQQLINRIREVVDANLPPDVTIIVVSKGDNELLNMGNRWGWHFPQVESGGYAGNYPADSAEAIAHLGSLRAKGGEYLLFPRTALWWLEYYVEFKQHLETHYRTVVNQENACVIFDLCKDQEVDNPCQEIVRKNHSEMQKPFGVNLVGHIASEKGVGEGVRSDIRSLEAANIPYVLNNFADPDSINQDMSFTRFHGDNPYSINLLHINADQVPLFAQQNGKTYFQGHYNIGYWAWELTDFPEEWCSSFEYFDEIWVPSNFALDAISRVASVPVLRIPHSVAEELTTQPYNLSHFDLPQDKFLFLVIFDFHSYVERKNPIGVIKAFQRAFGRNDDAFLVIKCSHSSPAGIRAIKDAAEGSNIQIIDTLLTREELNALLYLSDCYVSLHRAEGFGLTLIEAMSMGKPVIATGYSGNMDFMTSSNSFLVKYDLLEIGKEYGPYKKDCLWADPDLNHATELMKFVFENKELAREIGQKARQDILCNLHPRVVGALIKQRFLKIAAFGKIAATQNGTNTHPSDKSSPKSHIRYQRLIRQIREVARDTVPVDATVIVVTKGDDDLLSLNGSQAWHFPQSESGTYAGYYPADSAEAISHLELLRARGGEFLLFPDSAMWWLEHYIGFKQHLDTHYRVAAHKKGVCKIFALRELPSNCQQSTDQVAIASADIHSRQTKQINTRLERISQQLHNSIDGSEAATPKQRRWLRGLRRVMKNRPRG